MPMRALADPRRPIPSIRFLVPLALLIAIALLTGVAFAAADTDGDGFDDAIEAFVGTDPLLPCNQTTTANDEPDAWPPDFNDDRQVNILDVTALRAVYGTSSGQSGYNARYDLDASGGIGVTDTVRLRPVYGTACTPAPPPSEPGVFMETFDGEPSSPTSAYYLQDWDISVHSRDASTWHNLDTVKAQHGADCAAPPAIHNISAYEDSIYVCRNHMMTALNAQGYGVTYMTPNHLVDFSQGTAVISWDMSTFRSSNRDWTDVYVMPWNDNLKLPLEPWLPDLDGYPRSGVLATLGDYNNWSNMSVRVIRNFQQESVDGCWWCTWNGVFTPSPTRRDKFELHISKTHVKFGMPDYDFWPVDEDISALGWDKGIVQFGHHSYTPDKVGCSGGSDPALAGVNCGDGNTWHWDNFRIDPALPFTIIRGDRRYVDAGTTQTVNFSAAAPAGSFLRFSGTGTGDNGSFDLSFNNGATWLTPQKQPSSNGDDHYGSYWVPVPQGTTKVVFRGNSGRHMKDFAIFSPEASAAQVRASQEAAELEFVRDGYSCEIDAAPTVASVRPLPVARRDSS
jgi:hypothetical protein